MRLIMPYKNKEDARAYDKAWREANKERRTATNKALYEATKEYRKAYNSEWYYSNKEKKLATVKAWIESNNEKVRAYSRAYYWANKESRTTTIKAYREANKEKVAATKKAWRESNADKVSAYVSRRRALKLKLIPKHLKNCPIEKQRVIDIFKLCRLISRATGIQHHVDHMWPVSNGGPEWSGNMQIITARENLTKNASVDLELKHNIQQSLKETM
jgi:hypothetical protein